MNTVEVVQAVYAEVLKLPDPDLDLDLYALGGDSVQAVEIALELEMKFLVELPLETFEEHSDIRSVAAWIERERAAAGIAADPAG